MTGRTDDGASGSGVDGRDAWDAFALAHEWPVHHLFDVGAEIAASARGPAPDDRPPRFPLHLAAVRLIDDTAILSGEL